ncbi:MAG: toxin-antitoxin system YwqK family antitoxin [Bacteroidota bacterium]
MTKLKLCITLFLIVSLQGFSQENQDINEYDENGNKHGVWKKKYSNGEIQYKGEFRHGKPAGELKRYFPNGELMAIMNHRGEGEVYATLFNKEGKKRAEGKYIDKERDSTWIFYGTENNVILKENYNKGEKVGKSVRFYLNGDTSQIAHYRDGEKHGMFKQFFRNGNTKLLARYQNDELDGNVTIFSPNGYKEIEGLYRDNLRENKWIYYENTTDTARVVEYKNGEPLNKDSIELQETREIIRLENNEDKFGDPRDELTPPRRRQRRH